jgi:hypothetical protein
VSTRKAKGTNALKTAASLHVGSNQQIGALSFCRTREPPPFEIKNAVNSSFARSVFRPSSGPTRQEVTEHSSEKAPIYQRRVLPLKSEPILS